MPGDHSPEVKARVVSLVVAARGRRRPAPVRTFRCPELSLAVSSYTELVDLERLPRAADIEPPFTLPISEELGK